MQDCTTVLQVPQITQPYNIFLQRSHGFRCGVTSTDRPSHSQEASGHAQASAIPYEEYNQSGRLCLQFTAFLKVGLVLDMICLFNSETQSFHTILTLGTNVCGHPKIVHGGTDPSFPMEQPLCHTFSTSITV